MRILPILLLAIPMLLSGCDTVESLHPLSSPRAAVRDKRLEGLWRIADNKGNQREYLYVVYGSGNSGALMMFGGFEDGAIDRVQYNFFVTRTAKHNYLNLSNGIIVNDGHSKADHTGRYSFGEYHFTWLGQLVYSDLNGPGFASAVTAGKLKGKVTSDEGKSKGTPGNSLSDQSDTVLRDSPEHILNFIESSKPGDILGPPSKFDNVGGE